MMLASLNVQKDMLATDVPIVMDFQEVFLRDVSRLPAKLSPWVRSISIAAYRMTPLELWFPVGSTNLAREEEGYEYEVMHRLSSIEQGYNQIYIKFEDILKTTFRNRYGHYVYMVMSFGVTNELGVFMGYMNKIFHPYLNSFIVVFMDDILRGFASPQGQATTCQDVEMQLLAREYEFPKSCHILRRYHYGSLKDSSRSRMRNT
ncbi:Retrovirus-related Pol polyprotein from transposon 17.6, partial [Mucuna pruriens]